MSADTKEKVLVAALGCFKAHGISETRISQIQEASGVSTGSIYHHFGDNEGVTEALFEFGIKRLGHTFARA